MPPGNLNMSYILVIHTNNVQVSLVLTALCQPGGAVINFSKSPRNQNQTTLSFKKTLCYPKLLQAKLVSDALFKN